MNEWLLDLWIPGSPKAQGSMKHIGKGRMIHAPEMVKWRNHVVAILEQWIGTFFGEWEPLDEPVDVHAHFYLPRPANPGMDRAATGLDLDKLQRCVGDALEKAGVVKNDARIVRWTNPEKDWAHDFPGDGNEPGLRLKVRRL